MYLNSKVSIYEIAEFNVLAFSSGGEAASEYEGQLYNITILQSTLWCYRITLSAHASLARHRSSQYNKAVLPDRGWNLPSSYLPVWSRKTKTQWLPLSVTSLLRVMPKVYEDKRFKLVISRRPRLDRLFGGLRWFLSNSVYKTWQVDRNFATFNVYDFQELL